MRKLLPIVALILIAITSQAQNAANYAFSTTTGETLESMTSSTVLWSTSVDDASAAVALPFTFRFSGVDYTTIYPNSNGLISLGYSNAQYSNNIASAGSYPVIMALWDDLYTGSNGQVRYKVAGTAPNRKMVVEWLENNCCSGTPYDKTVQAWLYEGTNIIQFVYGAGANLNSASIGIAKTSTDFISVTSSTHTASSVTANNSNNVWPGSGRSYIFKPSAGALNFDGVNDYVSISNPFYQFGKEITVEWNADITSGQLGSGIGQSVENVDGPTSMVWIMHNNGNGTMSFYVSDNQVWKSSGAATIPAGWHKWVGVANATGIKLYMDGAVVASSATGVTTGILNVSNSVIHLGKDSRYASNRWMNGSIDEVRIWSRALCADELSTYSSCELGGAMTGLVEYYKFNQGYPNVSNASFTTLPDHSGAGKNGVLNNFSLTGTTSNWIVGVINGSCGNYVPSAATVTAGGSTSICPGQSVTLTANAGSAYQWYKNNVAIIGATAQTYTATQTGSYTVIVTSFSGCEMKSAATNVTATVIAQPVITASGPTTICSGQSVVLSAPASSGYSWSTGETTQSITVSQSGNYNVTVNQNGCTATSQNVAVTVKPTPVVSALVEDASCPGRTDGKISILAFGGNGLFTYYFNGTGSSNSVYPDLAPGNYNIYVESDGCPSATQLVTVDVIADMTPPSLTLNPANAVECHSSGFIDPGYVATDNCGNVTVTVSGVVDVNVPGNYTLTYTATDENGNSTTEYRTVEVVDTTPPAVPALPVITGTCSATATAPVAMDACQGVITGTTNHPLSYTVPGTYTIIWSFTDAYGNTSQGAQTVIVSDPTPPVIILNSNGALTALGTANTYNTKVANAANGLSHSHGIAYDLQRNTVWITDQDYGNDVLEFPATQAPGSTVTSISRFHPALTGTIEGIAFDATDNSLWIVDFNGKVGHFDRTGATLPGGFSVSATIPAGTFGARALGIGLQDNYIWVDNGQRAYKFDKSTGSYTNTNILTGQPGITYDPERHVLWTSAWNDGRFRAYDPATGNVVFTSAVVLNSSNQGLSQGHDLSIGAGKIWMASENTFPDPFYSIPIIGGAIDEIVECHGTYTDPGFTATDNCGTPAVNVTGSVNTNAPGTYTLTYTAIDAAGNMAVANRTVTVLDRTPPVPNVSSLPALTGQCSVTVTAPTATDACAGTITATTTSPLVYTAQGNYTIVWNYVDANGNTATQNQTVTVLDNTNPTITCPANATLASCETALPAYNATVSDNCTSSGNIVVTQSPAAGTAIASGQTITVTLTARDAAGNQSQCSFTVTRPNETPVAVNDATSVCTGNSVNINVLSNDSHPQGKTLIINDFTTPSAGTVVKNANNTFTYTAPAGYSGPVTFTYSIKASDATLGFSGNGHFYEWVASPGITWTNAKAQAATKTYNGLQGYLVTITSAAEMSFVLSKLQGQGWMGASDLAYEGTWRWVTGPEGLENAGLGRHFTNQNKYAYGNCNAAAGTAVNGYYTNWNGGEPNDCGATLNQYTPTDQNRAGEHYAHFISGSGLWNDYPNSVGAISGYVVEYGGLENCIPQLTATATVTVTVNAAPTVSISAPNGTASCPGTTVTLNAAATAGSGTITSYKWYNNGAIISGASGSTYGATVSGSYTVSVTNSNGCTATSTAMPVSIADAVRPTIVCPGTQTLSACTSAIGNYTSLATVSDNCTPAAQIVVTQSLPAGTAIAPGASVTITLTATDLAGNSSTCTFTVTRQAEVSASVTKTDVSCFAGNNGSISISASGGNGGYSYSIDGGNNFSATSTFSGLTANNYMVVVRDSKGCTTVAQQVAITQPTQLQVSATSVNVTCNGGTDGAVDLTVTGGTPGYSYVWSNGNTTEDISGLPAGSYNVTVTDANGCQATTFQGVSQPPVVTISAAGNTEFCNGGSVTLSLPQTSAAINFDDLSGGSGEIPNPYKGFVWTTNYNSIPMYYLNGNSYTGTGYQAGIVSPSNIAFNPYGYTQSEVRSVSGPFFYRGAWFTSAWYNQNISFRGYLNGVQIYTSGNYSLSTTTPQWIELNWSNIDRLEIISTNWQWAMDNFTVGSGAANPAGQWYLNGNPIPGATGESFTASQSGNYQYITTTGCLSNVIPVTVNPLPSFTTTTQNIMCVGGNDGSITIAATGGSGTYSYSINGGNSWQSSNVFNNLTVGTYNVMVQDVKGCSVSQTVTLIQQDNIFPVVAAQNITVQLNAQGQVTVDPQSVDAGSSDACGIQSYQLSQTVFTCANAGANQVTFTVTDNNNNSSSVTVTVTVEDHIAPQITCPASVTVSCDGSTAPASTGYATATDACGVESITFADASNQSADNSSPAHYNYTITRTWTATDIHGNVSVCVQLINVHDVTAPVFTRPADLTIYTDANCGFNSNVSVTGDVTDESDNCASGLQATYTDVVSQGSCQGERIITRTWSLVDYAGNAAANQVQTITVRDNTAPTFTRPADVTIYTAANCSYDASTAATGDVTNESDNCSTGIQATYSDVVTNGSCAGTKVITRTWHLVDNCGNAAADQVQTITVNDNTAPVFTSVASNVFHCYDDNTAGNYSVPAVAATDNCTAAVNWHYDVIASNGSVLRSGNSNNASGSFPAGSYTIQWTATDDCGNSTNAVTAVVINPLITGSISNFTVIPQGAEANTLYLGYTPASSATIAITAAGGTAPYTYSWSTNGSAASFSVVAGNPSAIRITAVSGGTFTYTVEVTDSKGCKAVFSKTITVVDIRCGNNNDKVIVCHVPSGNPGNPQTICIAPSAVGAHLVKGSYLGVCNSAVTVRSGAPKPKVIEEDATVLAYPNPNRGQFNLRLEGFTAGKIRIEIMDARGKQVLVKEDNISFKTEDVSINLNALAAGIYNIKITGDKQIKYTRVIIAR